MLSVSRLAAVTVSEEVKRKEAEKKEKEEEALLSHYIGCESCTVNNCKCQFEENLSFLVLSTTVRKTSQLKQEVW